MDKIEEILTYYNLKSTEIINYINNNSDLSVDQIIEKGEELSQLEFKMTALEIAKAS